MMQLELIPNLKPTRARPVEPIKRSAFIEGEYRWTLRRAWGAGPPIGWIMLNPSTAAGEKDDPTLWDIMCRSLRWGYGSLVVVNVCPFRTSNPKDLKRWIPRNGCPPMTFENGKIAGAVLKGVDTIVAAWGAHARSIEVEAFLENIAMEICDDILSVTLGEGDEYPIPLWCLGRTGSGAPMHPLARGKHRIPADQKLVPWKP